MNKKIILNLIFLIALVLPFISAYGNISFIIINKPLQDFVAGEIITTEFSFFYDYNESFFENYGYESPLILIVNITSDNSNFPVEKGDFQLNGSIEISKNGFFIKKYFNCVEDKFIIKYPFIPTTINIPKGIYYCTDKNYLLMKPNSNNKVNLNIQSNQALWPGEYNFSIGLFSVASYADAIFIFSPVQGYVYDNRMVLLNITLDERATIKYSVNRKRPINICANCSFYLRKKPFDEGINNLTFFMNFNGFGTILKNVNFIVDSIKPIIIDSSPAKGFANGTFKIEFEEANPISLILNYGNNALGYSNASLDLNKCMKKKYNTKTCSIDVNLSKYNQQGIIYWFNLRDITDKVSESRIRNLIIDFSKPVISIFNYSIGGRYKDRVAFFLKINELNFDKVIFIDKNSNYPVWKILCYSLNNGVCSQTKIFSNGQHNVEIRVLDKAGNYAEEKITIDI